MLNWLETILKVLPLSLILKPVVELLKEEAHKTETKIDDVAVSVIETILRETGLIN